MEPNHSTTMLGPGKDPDMDQELDNNYKSVCIDTDVTFY